MPKESLNPGDVEERFQELVGSESIPIADIDQIPRDKGGVYCFYWTGAIKGKKGLEGKLFDAPAPRGKPRTKVLINKEWLASAAGGETPLYVGSATVLLGRLRQQRAPDTEKVADSSTTTQVRKVLQKIFSGRGEAKSLFEKHVVGRYVLEDNPITRFYLEHKLIGDLLPLFNVKPEH